MSVKKPILCIDFDGVLHSYVKGWEGADVVSDPPVDGAMRFIWDASDHFRIAIFSSRSHQHGGIREMKRWLTFHFREYWAADRTHCDDILAEIWWPNEKPSAMVTLDDRAITFDGTWPKIDDLKNFQPWNKQPSKAALHASAPDGLRCADCRMDAEACPTCYTTWWTKRHPNVIQT